MSIISFYSYKGGTGRTTTMANTAVLLAQKGYNIACVDLDINAPGLDIVLGVDKCLPDRFITDYLKGMSVPVGEMCVEFDDGEYGEKIGNKGLKGKIYVFPTPRVSGVRGFGSIIDGMRDLLEPLFDKIYERLKVDHILVDSRSGYSRESAVLLPKSDKIFVSTRFSKQHIIGTAEVLKEVIQLIQEVLQVRGKNMDYYVVINDIPFGLPILDERSLKRYTEEYKAIAIRENKELRWADRIVVLDDMNEKDEEGRRQHEELLKGYNEIMASIIGND